MCTRPPAVCPGHCGMAQPRTALRSHAWKPCIPGPTAAYAGGMANSLSGGGSAAIDEALQLAQQAADDVCMPILVEGNWEGCGHCPACAQQEADDARERAEYGEDTP